MLCSIHNNSKSVSLRSTVLRIQCSIVSNICHLHECKGLGDNNNNNNNNIYLIKHPYSQEPFKGTVQIIYNIIITYLIISKMDLELNFNSLDVENVVKHAQSLQVCSVLET